MFHHSGNGKEGAGEEEEVLTGIPEYVDESLSATHENVDDGDDLEEEEKSGVDDGLMQ